MLLEALEAERGGAEACSCVRRAVLEPQHSLEGRLQRSKTMSVTVMVANLTRSSRH